MGMEVVEKRTGLHHTFPYGTVRYGTGKFRVFGCAFLGIMAGMLA